MILPIITLLPLAGALALLALPREEEGLHKGIAFAVSLATFAISLCLLPGFVPAEWNAVVDWTWVESLGIHFKLGVDGISLWLVILTTFLMPIVVLSAWRAIEKRVREFAIALLVLETGMIGAFVSLDLFVFYTFWEVMLIPMYFLIGIWGGDRRLYAAIKFVLYTMTGSLLMIVAILYLYVKQHEATHVWTFDYDAIRRVVLTVQEQVFCFLAFALAFCIKVPLWPLHTWLPDAHVEAPTAGSVILAGVLLKFGTYGLLRFALPIFPHAAVLVGPWIAAFAVVGVVYGSLVAWAQKDVKKLVAYSSVAHLGMVVLGLMAWDGRGVDGAMLTMLAHGISTSGLFLAIGVVYERRHTRRMDEFGGLASVMPKFMGVFMVMMLASVGLPGLSGFPGEFMILLGSFDAYRVAKAAGTPMLFGAGGHPKLIAAIAATGVILSAIYLLWLFQKMMFGPNNNPKNQHLRDLSTREVVVFIPMVIAAFWLGLFPGTFLQHIDPAVVKTISQFHEKYRDTPGKGETPRMLSPAGVDLPRPAPPSIEGAQHERMVVPPPPNAPLLRQGDPRNTAIAPAGVTP